MCITTKSLAF